MEIIKRFNINKKRPKVLLLGNGLITNSSDPNETKWEKMLIKMSSEKGSLDENFVVRNNNTIIASAFCEIDDKKRQEKITKNFVTLEGNVKYIDKLIDLGFDAIITTNYTYEIEKSIYNDYPKRIKAFVRSTDDRRERKYYIHTFNRLEKNNKCVDIWHMHGELRNPESIILTHNDYGNLISKIKEYLTKEKNRFNNKTIYFKSWVDYLIYGDVFILGKSLDYSEIDIWWLLSRRMRCKGDVGTYHLYCPSFELKENDDDEKRILQKFNVKREKIKINTSPDKQYDSYYKKAIGKIEKDFSK